MQWTKVESSQIDCLAYDGSAEYPLSIRFKNKKGGEQSVYEYANVTPELFSTFVNAVNDPDYDFSCGKFFERVIKSKPDLYPYRKVV
jgi:hypothetical protein